MSTSGTFDVVAALQTAASLETLAHANYIDALRLNAVQHAPVLVHRFNRITAAQHFQHFQRLNAALRAMGAPPQSHPDLTVANALTPKLSRLPHEGLAAAIAAAAFVEERLLASHVAYAERCSDRDLRLLFGSIAGVEAQHVAVLRNTEVLLAADLEQQIKLPPDARALPPQAATRPLPQPVIDTRLARPTREGAVR